MPVFTPPTDSVVAPIYLEPDSYRPAPLLAQRLFRFYGARARGRNVYKLTDGSYTETQPYPYIDASVQPGQPGDTTVLTTYFGGHVYNITTAEATALTNAGYGAYIA